MRRTVLALLMLLVFALPAWATHVDDGGVDMAWDETMNQATFWNTYFGGSCVKFENHSGFIPEGYEAAVIKDGNMVRVYLKAGPYTALGAVNPANGQHFSAPHSWVMKCNIEQTTTTTTQADEDTTTTTTTTPSSSTTTTPTTSSSVTTTSSVPEESTTTTPTTSTIPVESTTVPTVAPTTVTSPTDSTLPFTGVGEWSGLGIAGVALLALGYLLIRAGRQRTD